MENSQVGFLKDAIQSLNETSAKLENSNYRHDDIMVAIGNIYIQSCELGTLVSERLEPKVTFPTPEHLEKSNREEDAIEFFLRIGSSPRQSNR